MADEFPETDGEADDQDAAEAFDEETLGVGDDGRGTFEELPDLLDVTAAEGDEDDDEARIAEDMDDDEIIDAEQDEVLADPEDDDLAARGDEYAENDTVDVTSIPRR
ncbi:hypothetical protein ACO2Q3_10575 [Caulobacter sp. KR2-114]|uniref:hypothetical protein n=1 Tax=Caulobacter sp. KR2-114 TaxID=3400912 RepID=UPI003C0EFEE7